MKKAILFDFWGTLVENGVWSPIKQVRNILNIKMPFSEYVVKMERAMMTSKKSSLEEAFKAVCEEFDINCTNKQMEELIGMWNKSWMLAKPYDEIKETLESLKEKYTLILVSNTDCFSLPNVVEKFGLNELFHSTFLSFDVGLLKTDKGFLINVLKENNLKPEECLMVGDSVHSDMTAAKEVEIKGVLVDRRGKRDFQPKINNLRELSNHLDD